MKEASENLKLFVLFNSLSKLNSSIFFKKEKDFLHEKLAQGKYFMVYFPL